MMTEKTLQSGKFRLKHVLVVSFFALACCSCHNRIDLTRHSTDALFDSAKRLETRGLWTNAIHLVDSAYGLFPNISVTDKYVYYKFKMNLFSNHYSSVDNKDSSMLYADSMLLIIDKNHLAGPMAREYAEAYSCKGEQYFQQKRYDEAFRHFSTSKMIGVTLADSCMIGKYDAQLGLILYKQSKFREATAQFIECLSKTAACPTGAEKFYSIQGWLNSTGLCYYKTGSYDSAIYYFDRAEAYILGNRQLYAFEPKFPEIALGVVYGNEGQAWHKKGDERKAEDLYRKSIDINAKPGYDNQDATVTQLHLADLYLSTGNVRTAAGLLDEVGKALPVNEGSTRLTWLNLMSGYYTATGDAFNADRFLIRYLQYKDTLQEENKSVLQMNADAAYQRMSSQYNLDLLKKQNELKTIYLTVSVGMGIMLLLVILLVLRSWRRSKKYITELTAMNQVIASQNENMLHALKALEKSQKDNTRMLGIVAHDLRGPIGGIFSFAKMMREDKPVDQKAVLSMMQQAAENALSLIGDLLNISSSAEEITREPVDLAAMLQYCTALLQQPAALKEQRIIFERQPATTVGDREKLWRVFSNLITNAIKFSPEKTTINLQMRVQQDTVTVMVKDHGIGIPENLKDKILEMSPDAKRRGTRGEPSFGLGLAICKQIVQAHGGKLWFESIAGRGAAFYVTLTLMKKD